ncbi:MAG: prepilin-type N-terminal cleavage/methylation domain-containing protein [Thomasclavelia sp.]|nr:prepilin-type N-terminal cleavage/methylation domain-containing protein [Thomasclavelia sp.]
MPNKKGFTMIEMIFVISIIVTISILSLTTIQMSKSKYDNVIIGEVLQLIDEARTVSLTKYEKVDLIFKTKSLTIKSKSINKVLNLDGDYYFDDIKEIYYNDKGNINEANHINLCSSTSTKQIIFNLGSGSYYVK